MADGLPIAFVGTGYVADMYATTLTSNPELKLVGAYDFSAENLRAFVQRWPTRAFRDLPELQNDRTALVLNLTNPRSHFEVTKTCLEAGKHVYSEKPLAMTVNCANELTELARRQGVQLSSAPCSVLSETAQTLWKAIREGVVGKIRLVYANFDDGMIAPRMAPWNWKNSCGVAWPAKDEFEVGCTYEHAGYVLTWLAAFFGPALRVTSFASCQLPDKGISVEKMAPDFTVGCIEYAEGVVARVTCGLVAPRDKSLTVIGDDGELFVGNVRNDVGPVFVRHVQKGRWQSRIARRTEGLGRWLEARVAGSAADLLFQRKYPLVRKPIGQLVSRSKPVDFLRGPAEMAAAIREQRPCRLSAELGAHIVEIVETLQYPERFNHRKELTTTFLPIQPMPWAT